MANKRKRKQLSKKEILKRMATIDQRMPKIIKALREAKK